MLHQMPNIKEILKIVALALVAVAVANMFPVTRKLIRTDAPTPAA